MTGRRCNNWRMWDQLFCVFVKVLKYVCIPVFWAGTITVVSVLPCWLGLLGVSLHDWLHPRRLQMFWLLWSSAVWNQFHAFWMGTVDMLAPRPFAWVPGLQKPSSFEFGAAVRTCEASTFYAFGSSSSSVWDTYTPRMYSVCLNPKEMSSSEEILQRKWHIWKLGRVENRSKEASVALHDEGCAPSVSLECLLCWRIMNSSFSHRCFKNTHSKIPLSFQNNPLTVCTW